MYVCVCVCVYVVTCQEYLIYIDRFSAEIKIIQKYILFIFDPQEVGCAYNKIENMMQEIFRRDSDPVKQGNVVTIILSSHLQD